jgi:hypothetical protein
LNPSSTTQPSWRLGAQFPGAEGPGPTTHGVELHRPLDDDEVSDVDAASKLLRRVASARAYAQAVGLMRGFEDEHGKLSARDRPPPPAALGPLAEAAKALAVALSRVPLEIAAEARTDLDGGDGNLAEALKELTDSSEWRIACALPPVLQDPRRHLTVGDGQLHMTHRGQAGLQAAAKVNELVDSSVLAILRKGLLVAKRMIAQRLLAYANLIDTQSLQVRQLAAEVLLGIPVIVEIPGGQSFEEQAILKIQPLPLEEISAVQIALRQASQFLEADASEAGGDADVDEESELVVADEANAEAEPAEDRLGEGAETEAFALAAVEERPRSDPTSAGRTAPEDAPAPTPADPVDFELLIEHVSRLPGETERAWSDALDPDALGASHEVLRAQWSSVIAVLQRAVEQADADLRARGIDPRMKVHPEDPAVLETLELDGGPEEQWLAASVGQLRSLMGVLDAMTRLLDPKAGGAIKGPDDSAWWESGAFALIRLRAAALARAAAQAREAQARLAATRSASPGRELALSGEWATRLSLADEAISRGDSEAGILHLRLALRERAAQLARVPSADVPEDLEKRLAADPEVGDAAIGLRLLGDVANRVMRGEPPAIGFSVAVAEFMATPVRRLCFSLTMPLLRAVRPDALGPDDEELRTRATSEEPEEEP